jgi:hypothetical protein
MRTSAMKVPYEISHDAASVTRPPAHVRLPIAKGRPSTPAPTMEVKLCQKTPEKVELRWEVTDRSALASSLDCAREKKREGGGGWRES